MINFNTLKFNRTYLGGSKKLELEIFNKVQGLDENKSESDWFEYRRIFNTYSRDLLIVLMSWRYLLNIISYALLFLAILFTFANINVSIIIFILGIISRLGYVIVKSKELNLIFMHQVVLKIVSEKINTLTGLVVTN